MNTKEYYGTFWKASPIWWWDPIGREISGLDYKDSCVLETIARYLGPDTDEAVGRQAIADGSGLGLSTVDRSIKKLEKELDLVRVIRRMDGNVNLPNEYAFNMAEMRHIGGLFEEKMCTIREKMVPPERDGGISTETPPSHQRDEEVPPQRDGGTPTETTNIKEGIKEDKDIIIILQKAGLEEPQAKNLYLNKPHPLIKHHLVYFLKFKEACETKKKKYSPYLLVNAIEKKYSDYWWENKIKEILEPDPDATEEISIYRLFRHKLVGKHITDKGEPINVDGNGEPDLFFKLRFFGTYKPYNSVNKLQDLKEQSDDCIKTTEEKDQIQEKCVGAAVFVNGIKEFLK